MRRNLIICLIILLSGLLITGLNAKSLPKAMLMSAILPGSGEMYAGHTSRGFILTAVDVLLLFGANRFNNESHWLTDSYKQYARANAGIPDGMNADYYESIHKWYSSDEYNAELELYYRNLGLAYYNNPDYYADLIQQYSVPPELAWEWDSIADWKHYKGIRQDKQAMIMNRKLAVGALIANRVISVLDAAFLVRKDNRKNLPSLSLGPDLNRGGATLTLSMEF